MKQLSARTLRLVLQGALGLIQLTPLWMLTVLASVLSRARVRIKSRERDWFHQNLMQIFKLPPHSQFARMFMRQVYFHQIISVLETVRCIFRPDLARWEGLEDFERTVQQYQGSEDKKGQIIITGHLGCWELVGYWVARFSQNSFYALAKPAKNPALTTLLESLRSRMGIRVLWTGQKTIQRQMLKVLSSGGWLGFVMDQKPVGRQGPSVEFFGHQTEFVGGPAQMAVRASLPVVAVFCLRLGPMHYRLLCREVAPPGHGIMDKHEMTRLMAAEIERVIRVWPEQWCWNYRRWRFDDIRKDPAG